MKTAFPLVMVCTLLAAGSAAAQKPEYLTAPGADAQLPFSEGVRVGNMLYLSGMIGVLPGTMTLAEGGIVAETRQTLDNIRAALERHGSSLDNVVKCLVMLVDMSEWRRMNEVYATYFPEKKPARSSFGATGLALGARVEIECMAVVEK